MSWTYELMYLPRRHASSYVLVTSRGASVAIRIYADAMAQPTRIDGKNLAGLPALYSEARAAGKPIVAASAESTKNAREWWARISRANRAAGLALQAGGPGPSGPDRPPPVLAGAPPAASSATPGTGRGLFFTNSGRPLRSMADWQALHPSRHWKAGYSAMEMARSWHHAQGFPPAVADALSKGPFGTLAIDRGVAECLTAVPGAGRPSHTDLMVEARSPSMKVVVGVEAKVHESFGPGVDAWLGTERPGRPTSGKEARLQGLCDGLGLDRDAPSTLALRYQLLHRSWAALSHARETGAKAAVLLIHALADGGDAKNRADYQAFLRALGSDETDVDAPVTLGPRGGMPFWAVWVRDRPLPR